MADVNQTIAQLAKLNDRNVVDAGATDIFKSAPLIQRLAAVESSNGTIHQYLKRTGDVPADFRNLYEGIENNISTDTVVQVTLKIEDASFHVDWKEKDVYQRGSLDEYLARETVRHLESSFAVAEKQIIYGTVHGKAAGFLGLANSAEVDATTDPLVVDAAGTTAGTASSVFFIKTGESDVAFILKDGKIEVADYYMTKVTDATGKHYDAYRVPIAAWMGLQLGGTRSVGRIANLTADAGKGLTDARIGAMLTKLGANRPDFMVMGYRSLWQLQASRTATSPTGAEAPIPTEVHGVPIVVSPNVIDTEALIA